MPVYLSEMVAHPESRILDLVRPDFPLSRRIQSFFDALPELQKNPVENTLICLIYNYWANLSISNFPFEVSFHVTAIEVDWIFLNFINFGGGNQKIF